MSNPIDRITLVYRDAAGNEHTQPLADITEVGTLIDPEDGSDMELVDARIRPVGNPIVLGAESVRAELADDEAPDAHDLTEKQAEFLARLTDEEIDRAVNAEADDYFWAAYDDVRSRAIASLVADHQVALAPLGDDLVNIVHLSGDDYENAVDEANANGGSIEAVVAYLARWDYGRESDGAAQSNGLTALAELERLPYQLHEVDLHGLHYWLQLDHGLRFYALYRRPL